MRWEAMQLPEGPYGLRDITVYQSNTAWDSSARLVATYLGNRMHAMDLKLTVDMQDNQYGVRPVARATVKIHDYEYDRGKARDWLLDMCYVWAKGD